MYYRNKIADGGQEKRLPQCKQTLQKTLITIGFYAAAFM
jgi:hypothetical protein